MGSLRDMRTVVFKLDQLSYQHPLRLDPVARLGVLEIAGITLLDIGTGRVLRSSHGLSHLHGEVSAEELSFLDRRHVDIANLRAGSADLPNRLSDAGIVWRHLPID